MYSTFERLGGEKRLAILNAALDEFAARGYDRASTNEIVHKAGISKGALFHYFGEKKGLFTYVCDYVSALLDQEYYGQISDTTGDLIHRLRESMRLRLELLEQYPRLFAFCTAMLTDRSDDVQFEIAFFRRTTSEAQYHALLEGLDGNLIRTDIPAVEAHRMLWWILEGYSNELIEQLSGEEGGLMDLGQEMQTMEQFIELTRRIFYRTEQPW